MKNFRNKYYFLRHGRNIHQTELKHICYGWPEDTVPCMLDEVGIKEVTVSGTELKDKNIDVIYSSDILRTKQTSEIVALILGIDKIYYDERLRDMNWGIFSEGLKSKVYEYYEDKDLMNDSVPEGECWRDLQKRAIAALKDIDKEYDNKNILIVTHGDVVLLLEAYLNDWDFDEIWRQKENVVKTGEWRKYN